MVEINYMLCLYVVLCCVVLCYVTKNSFVAHFVAKIGPFFADLGMCVTLSSQLHADLNTDHEVLYSQGLILSWNDN